MRVAVLVSCAVLGLVAGRAKAQDPSVETVRHLLSGVEHVAAGDTWKKLGERALPLLATLYASEREPMYVRLRAVQAAGYFSNPEARAFLHRVLDRSRHDELFVRQALLAMTRAFGADSVSDVAPSLRHSSAPVRAAAVHALARAKCRTSFAELRRVSKRESDPNVQREIHKALSDAP